MSAFASNQSETIQRAFLPLRPGSCFASHQTHVSSSSFSLGQQASVIQSVRTPQTAGEMHDVFGMIPIAPKQSSSDCLMQNVDTFIHQRRQECPFFPIDFWEERSFLERSRQQDTDDLPLLPLEVGNQQGPPSLRPKRRTTAYPIKWAPVAFRDLFLQLQNEKNAIFTAHISAASRQCEPWHGTVHMALLW